MLNKERVEELREILKKYKIDGYLMGPNFDLKYLTGIDPFPDERFKALYVGADGSLFFICPELYYEDFRNTLGEDITMLVWGDNDGVNDTFKKVRDEYELEGKIIGIDDSIRGIDLLDMIGLIKANFINEPSISKDLRIMKSTKEVELLQKAADIADKTFQDILQYIKPGVKEKEISDKLKELLIENGGEGLSFEPIVASGPNSSMPHYGGDQRIIKDQDLLILDYGCIYKGYCSDISRTVFVGEPTDKQKEVYRIVLEANTKAENEAKEGVSAEHLDQTARRVIREAGYGQYFINRTGHGIGIEVHEEPYIKDGNKEILKTGMAFSIEPGIYIPGEFGMRVEDIVVVNGDGRIILNKAPKEMTILK